VDDSRGRRSGRCTRCLSASRTSGSRCRRCPAPAPFRHVKLARGQSNAGRDRRAPSGSSALSSRLSRSDPFGSWPRPGSSPHRSVPVVDVEALIGLKLQAIANEPSRRGLDEADIRALLAARGPEPDLDRLRDYYSTRQSSESGFVNREDADPRANARPSSGVDFDAARNCGLPGRSTTLTSSSRFSTSWRSIRPGPEVAAHYPGKSLRPMSRQHVVVSGCEDASRTAWS